MSRNLVVFFDGTWNKDEAEKYEYKETNVRRIFDSIKETELQKKLYIEGVGTESFWDKIFGGLSGHGLSENIIEAYKWLAENFIEGDKIFTLGFSRGAYSARSLVGMIRNTGLLHQENIGDWLYKAYEIYRQRDEGPDTDEALKFRAAYSWDPKVIGIHFVGIWDTVGSLGIPGNIDDKTLFEFHDTRLSSIVKNAFHAVAIDEHRKDFDVTLWNPISDNPNQVMEQRWFAGAHSDIGGGYKERDLSDITLKWMEERASDCGLVLDPEKMIQDVSENYLLKCHDSCFGKQCSLLAKICFFIRGQITREIGRTKYGHETIDESVSLKCEDEKCFYCPKNPGMEKLNNL